MQSVPALPESNGVQDENTVQMPIPAADAIVPLSTWNYDEMSSNGPQSWPKRFGKNKHGGHCDGQAQSPVNIVSSLALQGMKEGWEPRWGLVTNLQLVNDGHSITMVGDALSQDLSLFHGQPYKLKRMTVKKPSESMLNGMQFPMEMQYEHEDADGHPMVVAVLFREGIHNQALDALGWSSLPKRAGESLPIAKFVPSSLLPKGAQSNFWHYMGSLSQPPCTEGVPWIVVGVHPPISPGQLSDVPIAGNIRPVQPLNGRVPSFLNGAGPAAAKEKHKEEEIRTLGFVLHSITDLEGILKSKTKGK
jgi:carbonic anhydrase